MNSLWRQTPMYSLDTVSKEIKRDVYAKMECFQPSGSFKARGISILCEKAVENGSKHIVSSSGGNAGFTAAYVGKMLGVRTTVFVPEPTPEKVRDAISAEGAELIVHGAVWDETDEFAKKFAEENHAVYVPPFDDPALWDGYASMIKEAIEQCPKPGAVVLAVGGGGLLCGVIEGLQRYGWGDVPVVAVETEGAASLSRSLKLGYPVTLEKIDTVATSLAPKKLAPHAFDQLGSYPIRSAVVSDSSAISACRRFADEYRVLVEPACGAALAVVFENHEALGDADTVLVIVCGGIGVNLEKLNSWAV